MVAHFMYDMSNEFISDRQITYGVLYSLAYKRFINKYDLCELLIQYL